MLEEPDWDAAEMLLVKEGNRAIENFSAKHAAELCSFFAFSVDYCFGDVVICFDTYDNSLLHAKRHEARILKSRDAALSNERGWESAKSHLQRHMLCSYNPHTADFTYPNFAKLHFLEWEEYFGSDQLHESPDPLGHVIVLTQKAINKLVASRSFDRLAMSSPFRVGVEFPEELGLVVMRVLNWPPHQGPRI